ncbi:MAG: hypothetical protein JWR15_3090, partial [Prosthecobacter sp.]|nr:hypothetical protein [Prosthecobacter sp.]
GSPEARLLSSDNITIQHCWIYDAQQAAGCTKDGILAYPAEARQATQFKNWQVCNNVIDTCGNKAVELAECNGGLIADNHITNVVDGPQVIFGSRNVQIRDNIVYFTDTGINITEGSNHIRVSGNHVEPVAGIDKAKGGGCLFFRTEPQPLTTSISDIVVTGNIFRDPTTRGRRAIRFQTRDEALYCTYQGIIISDNIIEGNAYFSDPRNPRSTALKDILFSDNICEGEIMSVSSSTMRSENIVVRGNMLRKSGDCVLNASHWVWTGNTHTGGTLKVAAGAAGNVIHENVTATPVADNGTGTSLSNNSVIAKTSP